MITVILFVRSAIEGAASVPSIYSDPTPDAHPYAFAVREVVHHAFPSSVVEFHLRAPITLRDEYELPNRLTRFPMPVRFCHLGQREGCPNNQLELSLVHQLK